MTDLNPENKAESKVLFIDGEKPRVLKGTIVSEDEDFVVLRRRDSEVRLAKRHIIKIETKRVSKA